MCPVVLLCAGRVPPHAILCRPRVPPCCAAIEDDYSGPTLDDGKVTAQFMQELMVWFKDQKLLHKKYAFKVRVPDFLCRLISSW